MTITTQGGLRERLFIDAIQLSRLPMGITYTLDAAQSMKRARDGDLRRHVNAPYPGCPEVPTKLTLKLSWDVVPGADLDAINDLIGYGGPANVALWRPVSETFWLYPGIGTGTLQRRDASSIVPSGLAPFNAAVRYAPLARLDGSTVSLALGSITSKYRTPFTVTAPVSASRLSVRYYPLFRCYVQDGQPVFGGNATQGQTLTLIEV